MKEWLNANMSCAYPLADSTAGVTGTLPTSLFVDAFFDYYNIDEDSLYIAKIDVVSNFIIMQLGASLNNTQFIFNGTVYIPTNITPYSRVDIELINDETDSSVCGYLLVGDLTCVEMLSVSNTYTINQTKFFQGCVRDKNAVRMEGVTGIRVNGGAILTGVVDLEFGDNIGVLINGNTVTVSVENYQVADKYSTDQDIEDLVKSYTAGAVTSINGQNGDVQITLANDYLLFGVGTGTLQIKPDDEAKVISTDEITSLANGISRLNDRVYDISQGIASLDCNLNNLSVQVARIQ